VCEGSIHAYRYSHPRITAPRWADQKASLRDGKLADIQRPEDVKKEMLRSPSPTCSRPRRLRGRSAKDLDEEDDAPCKQSAVKCLIGNFSSLG